MSLFKSSPYMAFPKRLPDWDRSLLAAASYRIVAGPGGLPVAQLDLRFQPSLPGVVNPDMALAVLFDRSGSMDHAYRSGHVFNAANAILQQAGAFAIAFYDTRPTYAGQVGDPETLQRVIADNAPRGGGTMVTAALRGMIERYRGAKAGIYVIVVTDGEFADKAQVERLVLDELAPQLTAEHPNAVRIHFIGAGGEVDRPFLERLESEAAARGAALVRQHHHAHLHHAHATMIDELATLYLGVGSDGVLRGTPETLARVGEPRSGRWHDGSTYPLPFVPRTLTLALGYVSPHADTLHVALAYTPPAGERQQIPFVIPLPVAGRQAAAPAAGDTRPRGPFHLPWQRPSPEARAAREEAARRAQEARAAELRRQSDDLQELARGGIPTGAQQRLRELAGANDAFTSDLAPDELGLLRHKGLQARGLVTGSALYHVGQTYASSYRDSEVRELSDAYNTAMALAVSRMEQEVRLLGAHGALGVRLNMVRHEWAEGTVEVQIVGTAVAAPGPLPAMPWLSDLSGQEWWALTRAGYEACGLVYGHCAWFLLTTTGDEWIKQTYANQEFRHWGDGLAQARRRALARLMGQARAVRAHGVTGMTVARKLDEVRLSGYDGNPVYEYEHHTLVLSLIGTAVRLRPDAPRAVAATRPILSLRDGRLTPAVAHPRDASFDRIDT